MFSHHIASKNESIKQMKNEIKELKQDGYYFKVIKRLVSIDLLKGNHISTKLLKFLNSNYGLLYKVIVDLNSVLLLLLQTNKSVKAALVDTILDNIKEFSRNLLMVDISNVIDAIIKLNKKEKIMKLNTFVNHLENMLNIKAKDFI